MSNFKQGEYVWFYPGGQREPQEVIFDVKTGDRWPELAYVITPNSRWRWIATTRLLFPTKAKALCDRIMWCTHRMHELIDEVSERTQELSEIATLQDKTYDMVYKEHTDG